ncbi:IS1 family transposase [Vibrio kanaloae]|uniref:IS1 family transposase n=1 Tax=Vibrio kanaloae TaxID=170673 RepID=A0A4U1WF53_9VIBR|nr:IS1 family transposase [Vibrio kanaloae]TKF21841.1 IS1 family transposase [Vibrio kanaloae]TKF24928.1 IS1 family transposase [Vibrio kanaloae]TKF74012.1 IS1 family transposase [Vibrio kanaloae]
MTTKKPNCRYCHKSDCVIKHGYGPNGHQRFRCPACRRTFQVNYCYEACKPGIRNRIIEMTAQNHGKRETSRHLHVAYNTVLSTCHRVRKKVSTL